MDEEAPGGPGGQSGGWEIGGWDWWIRRGREWWCNMAKEEVKMTPDEYIDFHIRIEEDIRREQQQGQGAAPGENGDAGDTLCLQGGDGGPK